MIELIVPWPFRTLLSSASCSNFTNVLAPNCFATSITLSWQHTNVTIRRTKNCINILSSKYIILFFLKVMTVQNTKTRDSISLEFELLPVVNKRLSNIECLTVITKFWALSCNARELPDCLSCCSLHTQSLKKSYLDYSISSIFHNDRGIEIKHFWLN